MTNDQKKAFFTGVDKHIEEALAGLRKEFQAAQPVVLPEGITEPEEVLKRLGVSRAGLAILAAQHTGKPSFIQINPDGSIILLDVEAVRKRLELGTAALADAESFVPPSAAKELGVTPLGRLMINLPPLTGFLWATPDFVRPLTQEETRQWIGAGTGDAEKKENLTQFAVTKSEELRKVIEDTTGEGPLVFAKSPKFEGPVTYDDNIRQTFNPGDENCGLNVGSHPRAAKSPSEGDIYFDRTERKFKGYDGFNWITLG